MHGSDSDAATQQLFCLYMQDIPKLNFCILFAGAMTNKDRHLEAMQAKVSTCTAGSWSCSGCRAVRCCMSHSLAQPTSCRA
jgi:hypothetical protein